MTLLSPVLASGFFTPSATWQALVCWIVLLLLLLLLSHVSRVRLCDPIDSSLSGSHPWDSPGKNTGVGCHFLLQHMKVKSEREVTQLCPTLHDPMDCSLPASSVHGVSQARVLEWAAIAFSGYIVHRVAKSQIRQQWVTSNSTHTCTWEGQWYVRFTPPVWTSHLQPPVVLMSSPWMAEIILS